MAYTTINKSSEHFNTKLYTGNGGTQALTGLGFEPSFTWIKQRDNGVYSNALFDAVRGVGKMLVSDTTATNGNQTNGVTAFGSDGFTVGDFSAGNYNARKYVSWNWKANGAGSSNTTGSLTSTVSANTTSGFSIVQWTGNRSQTQTIGHGLGSIPKMIIIKNISVTQGWTVYSSEINANQRLVLNSNATEGTCTACFANTRPTNTVFTVGDDADTNGTGNTMIAYCFSDVQGYQKIGSYTGNNPAGGSNTQFVYTGFTPKLVMFKEMSGAGNWNIYDLNRNYSLTENNYNIRAARLAWNENSEESSFTDDHGIDILSNGFVIRDNSNDFYTVNANNETYMYYAVAETPLVGSNNVPATAK